MPVKPPVYVPEVERLLKELAAQGIILIVVKGNRNKDEVEITSAIRGLAWSIKIPWYLKKIANEIETNFPEAIKMGLIKEDL